MYYIISNLGIEYLHGLVMIVEGGTFLPKGNKCPNGYVSEESDLIGTDATILECRSHNSDIVQVVNVDNFHNNASIAGAWKIIFGDSIGDDNNISIEGFAKITAQFENLDDAKLFLEVYDG